MPTLEKEEETNPTYSLTELIKMRQFTQELAAAVHELHRAGAQWDGGYGVMILMGTDEKGSPVLGVATDGASNLTVQAAAKALQAYTDVIVPPEVPGQYL